MNRIPVVNDEQRAGYGAPTTVVGSGLTAEAAAVQQGYAEKYAAKKPAAKSAQKTPAAKAKATK